MLSAVFLCSINNAWALCLIDSTHGIPYPKEGTDEILRNINVPGLYDFSNIWVLSFIKELALSDPLSSSYKYVRLCMHNKYEMLPV